ncbi:aminoglycoside N(3)-acetyltransferase [Paenibacillus aestuarii]|uniref:Aminoglycoside N(3)-acetyltransferase n=1 Tax=Paenibacillus aestuarii TaxID=516965 RepID=A0ABW0KD82_9BACL|nr:AAC(3) family N-acetyltransferase [Paenibacillus aestuarii]
MSEKEIVNATRMPITVRGMVQDLVSLGIREGDRLLVHASLSRLGWVCGGPQAVVQALMDAVGKDGTLVMPAQSGDWSDPAEWGNPPVPHDWIEVIYRELPAFDPAITPTRGMGRIAELFRTFPGTLRSRHPQVSFCANGYDAEQITTDHPLTPQFGMSSPLGKLYELNAKVLLLGTGFRTCTSFHLAETLLAGMPVKRMGTAMLDHGERVWKWFDDFAYDSEDFAALGTQLEQVCSVRTGNVGHAACKLLDMKEAVDFAAQWLKRNR